MAKKKQQLSSIAGADGELEQDERDGADIVSVKSTLPIFPDGGSPVALFEIDTDHPGGQVYIAGPKPVRAALTPEVIRLLREGVIVEVDDSEVEEG